MPLPPLLLRSSLQAGALLISFDTGLGTTYLLQDADALNVGAWCFLTNITATSTNALYYDPLTSAPQRFYRVMTTGK